MQNFVLKAGGRVFTVTPLLATVRNEDSDVSRLVKPDDVAALLRGMLSSGPFTMDVVVGDVVRSFLRVTENIYHYSGKPLGAFKGIVNVPFIVAMALSEPVPA